MKKEQSNDLKPPGVFLVPFILLGLPSFILGTLWAFIEIGFRSGNRGVFKIYFAKAEAEYAAQRAKQRAEEAQEIADQIGAAMKRAGHEGEMTVIPMESPADDKE